MLQLIRRLLVAGLLLQAVVSASVEAQVSVTYVANEGFLLASGEHKVLVDALLDAGIPGYARIPPELRPSLEEAQAPFDGVDVVLATHYHDDHFGPSAVARHLEKNSTARFVSTPQAVEKLSRTIGVDSPILKRVLPVYPNEGSVTRLDFGTIQVTALNLHHGRNRNPPAQNLGFLVQLGGLKILHIGDTEVGLEDLDGYRDEFVGIHVGLISSWFLAYPHWQRVVRERFRPTHIVAMHLAEETAPSSFFGRSRSRPELLRRIRAGFPEVVLLEDSLDSRNFPKRDAGERPPG